MRAGIWTEGSVSVILLPPNETGDKIFDLAQNWTRIGLLRPAMWLRQSDATFADGRPPQIPVHVLGLSPVRELHNIEVDLFEQLAQHVLRIVRVISLRVIGENADEQRLQYETSESVARYIERSLPLPAGDSRFGDIKTRLLKMNIVVAPTEHSKVEKSLLLEPGWDINIIASPEDRSNPWTADAFVREGTQLYPFALANIVTAAGLWNGLPSGAFDDQTKSEGQAGRIIVPRIFVRAVSSDGLARRVSTKVLRDFSDSNNSSQAGLLSLAIPGTRSIPEYRINDYQEWLIQKIFSLDENRLVYIKSAPAPEVEKYNLMEWEQLKQFLAFAMSKIVKIPIWTWQSIRARIGRKMTRKFQGDEGYAVVGVDYSRGADPRDIAVRQQFQTLQDMILKLDIDQSATISEELEPESSPILWSGIRKLFFALLDGSSLPDGVDAADVTYETDRLVFERVSDLAFRPTIDWTWQEGPSQFQDLTLDLSDSEALSELVAELNSVSNESALRLDELVEAIQAKKREIKRATATQKLGAQNG